jgi:hypothetical protein
MIFRLLKNVKNWAFNYLQGIADAEDRFVKSMFTEEDKNERK